MIFTSTLHKHQILKPRNLAVRGQVQTLLYQTQKPGIRNQYQLFEAAVSKRLGPRRRLYSVQGRRELPQSPETNEGRPGHHSQYIRQPRSPRKFVRQDSQHGTRLLGIFCLDRLTSSDQIRGTGTGHFYQPAGLDLCYSKSPETDSVPGVLAGAPDHPRDPDQTLLLGNLARQCL